MIKTQRKTLLCLIGALVLSMSAIVCVKMLPTFWGSFFNDALTTLPHIVYVGLLIGWVISVQNRILNPKIRRYLVAVGILMILWLTARTVKWRFLPVVDPIGRYLWYAYYIPMIFIPLIGVCITDCIGKTSDYKTPLWLKLLFVPATLLVAFVFTNDFHNLVFVFPNGIELFDSDYGYGFGFYIVCAWFIILGFYFVISLFTKSRVPGSKTFQVMPLIIMGGSVVFWIFYALGLFRTDLTAVDCIMITLLLESAIESGLIRSNAGYTELFEISTVEAQVVDKNFQTKYISSYADELSEDIIKSAVSKPVKLSKTVLHAKPVSGGYVLWHDDIRQIKKLTESLAETRERLSENNVLLKAEIEIREQKARLDEKNRLYDRIALDVSSQLIKAEELLAEAERNPESAQKTLSQICVISAYIKRRSNLLLLGEESNTTSSSELDLCLRESLDNLELAGVLCITNSSCSDYIRAENAVAVYDLFEKITENFIGYLNSLFVSLACNNSVIKLRLQLGCDDGADISVLKNLCINGGNIDVDIDGNDITVDILLYEGGASFV